MCLYNEPQSILQAQNDNRIQLTSNGFTAHINLPLCRVTNDLTPFVKMEFLIAHCSMCCDAHIVNGTLLKSVRNLSLQNKLANQPDTEPTPPLVSSNSISQHYERKKKKRKLTSLSRVRRHAAKRRSRFTSTPPGLPASLTGVCFPLACVFFFK